MSDEFDARIRRLVSEALKQSPNPPQFAAVEVSDRLGLNRRRVSSGRRRSWLGVLPHRPAVISGLAVVAVVIAVLLGVTSTTGDRSVSSTSKSGRRPAASMTAVLATYLPQGLASADAQTVGGNLFGKASPGQAPGPMPSTLPPSPEVARLVDTTGWLSPKDSQVGILLEIWQGDPEASAPIDQAPASQAGSRSVRLEVSPVVDETLAVWQESAGTYVLVNSRGVSEPDLREFIAGLRFGS